jgi:hypothetical protein
MEILGFCAETASIWMILGYVVLIIKIVIPLLLIVFGMIDLGKAVIASKDDAIKSSVNSLIKRFIAAIAIFFVPTLVSAVFNLIGVVAEGQDANVCVQCVTNVGKCSTAGDTNKMINK